MNERGVRPYRSVASKPSNSLRAPLLGRVRPRRRASGFVPGRDVRRRWDGQGHEASLAYGGTAAGFCGGVATRTRRLNLGDTLGLGM